MLPVLILELVTFIYIFRYLFILFFTFFVKENAYIFDILLGILGFIGGIEFSLSILLLRIFLETPYLTLFIRLYFTLDDD